VLQQAPRAQLKKAPPKLAVKEKPAPKVPAKPDPRQRNENCCRSTSSASEIGGGDHGRVVGAATGADAAEILCASLNALKRSWNLILGRTFEASAWRDRLKGPPFSERQFVRF